jgi:hypothetical protein
MASLRLVRDQAEVAHRRCGRRGRKRYDARHCVRAGLVPCDWRYRRQAISSEREGHYTGMADKKKATQASAVGPAQKQRSHSQELLGKAIKREARRSIREAFPPALSRRRKLETRKRLIPGLRERLLSTLEGVGDLNAQALGSDLFVEYLALTTGTAVQTARRWIAAGDPGLPDLISFAMLCDVLQADVNWMLGLTKTRLSLPRDDADWLKDLVGDLVEAADGRQGVRVLGDEMEPAIMAGDWVLVDTSARKWGSNGTYVLQWKGRQVLRSVETRLGEGFVLGCANPKYAPTVIRDEAQARERGIRLIGRVEGRIALARL